MLLLSDLSLFVNLFKLSRFIFSSFGFFENLSFLFSWISSSIKNSSNSISKNLRFSKRFSLLKFSRLVLKKKNSGFCLKLLFLGKIIL